MKRFAISFAALALSLLLLDQSAQAAARVWGNAGTDYNTSANWNAGAGPAPGVGDVGQFSAAEVTQPNISVSLSNSGLYFFGASTSGYDITGSAGVTLTLTGRSTSGSGGTSDSSAAAIRADNTSGNNTVDVALLLSPTTSSNFVQASGGTLIINGAISSAAGINLSLRGGGAITLNGANSQATTSIDTASEVVTLGNDSALGAGLFTVGASSTIQASSARTLANSFSLSTGTLTIGGTNAIIINGSTTAAGAVSRTLTVNNTALTTLAGSVFLSDVSGTGRTLVINGTGNVTISGVIADFNGSGTAGTLSHSGTGTLTLTNTNTYSGGTTMSGGTTISTHNGAFGTGNVSLTASNVILTLQGVTNSIADTASLAIGIIAGNSNDVVNLNFAGTETVFSLSVNGVQEAAGVYGATGSGAQFELAQLMGTGTLTVLSQIPEPATYMLIGLGALVCAQQFRKRKKA